MQGVPPLSSNSALPFNPDITPFHCEGSHGMGSAKCIKGTGSVGKDASTSDPPLSEAVIDGCRNYCRKQKSLGLLAIKIISMYEHQTRIKGKSDHSRIDCDCTASKRRKCEKPQPRMFLTSKCVKDEDVQTTVPALISKTNDKEQYPKQSKKEQQYPTNNTIPTLSIDQTASQLRVERRRIYDIVNILEALSIVSKRGKNLYWWHGFQELEATFRRLQCEAMQDESGLLVDAERNGMIDSNVEKNRSSSSLDKGEVRNACKKISLELDNYGAGNLRRGKSKGKIRAVLAQTEKVHPETNSNSNKIGSTDCSSPHLIGTTTFGSLGLLSKRFLQLYLVGYDSFSLGDATHRLFGDRFHQAEVDYPKQGTAKENTTEITRRKEEAKRCKTKFRRLYDIANVLVSIGVIKKTTNLSSLTSSTDTATGSSNLNRMIADSGSRNLALSFHKNNQYFCWNYRITPQELLDGVQKK